LTGHTDAVNAVAFSRDGDKFATGGSDRFGKEQLRVTSSMLQVEIVCLSH